MRIARRRNWRPRPIGSAAFSRSHFRDQNDETSAAQVERSLSAWRRLRDTLRKRLILSESTVECALILT